MTVGELIEALKRFPSEERVICRGYEGGYGDIGAPTAKTIVLNVNDAWYYGPHEEPWDGYKDYPDKPRVNAVLIG